MRTWRIALSTIAVGGRVAVLVEKVFFERAGIDADADRHAAGLRGLRDLATRSVEPMLPGFRRMTVDALDRAPSARGGSRSGCRRSAESRICERILPSAFASRSRGTATRTMSQPASSRRWISSSVASTSSVFVVVIDWTAIGASPPTRTSPTLICLLLRRETTEPRVLRKPRPRHGSRDAKGGPAGRQTAVIARRAAPTAPASAPAEAGTIRTAASSRANNALAIACRSRSTRARIPGAIPPPITIRSTSNTLTAEPTRSPALSAKTFANAAASVSPALPSSNSA